jgi:cytochrome c oxidase subunit 2
VVGGRALRVLAGAAVLAVAATIAAKAELLGAPVPRQMGFLPSNTPIQDGIEWFHNDVLMPAILGISVLVTALLAYCVWRFHERTNPVPSRTTHNGPLEIAWTIAPALVLVIIAVPDTQSDGVAVALELRLSEGCWRVRVRFPDERRQGVEARRYSSALG